jgi:hypothetical protein
MPGTPKVGYMPPVSGGFACRNCKHFKETKNGTGCDQKEVRAELGESKAGLAAVDENGCCNEFDPKKPGTLGGMFVDLARKGSTK